MCAETVVFDSAAPVVIHHFRTILFGTDTVHPVIFVGKAAARPAKNGNLEVFQGIEYVGTVTFDIGYIGVLAHPKASVDTSTQMFGKLAVNFFGNNLLGRREA